jgi:DnaJ-class molecular chaperone
VIVFDECPVCQGEGIMQIGPDRDPAFFARMGTCEECHGEGQVESDRMPTRAECYDANLHFTQEWGKAIERGAPEAEVRRFRVAAEEAWAEYRAWVEADTEAAIAGVWG